MTEMKQVAKKVGLQERSSDFAFWQSQPWMARLEALEEIRREYARSPENAAGMVAALDRFGFGSLDLKAEDFLAPKQIIQLGNPPNRIDLLTTVSRVEFAACYPARITVDVEGVAVDFIDLENLKKSKQAAGRHQDLADPEKLE